MRECCRKGQAEKVSNSINKSHLTWGPRFSQALYRVTMVVKHLGWVDSDFRECARLMGCYFSYLLQKKRVKLAKFESTQPRYRTTLVTL